MRFKNLSLFRLSPRASHSPGGRIRINIFLLSASTVLSPHCWSSLNHNTWCCQFIFLTTLAGKDQGKEKQHNNVHPFIGSIFNRCFHLFTYYVIIKQSQMHEVLFSLYNGGNKVPQRLYNFIEVAQPWPWTELWVSSQNSCTETLILLALHEVLVRRGTESRKQPERKSSLEPESVGTLSSECQLPEGWEQ